MVRLFQIIHVVFFSVVVVGAFLFSFLCVLGSSLFAFGSHLRGTGAMLPVMLIGRLLFGAGNGSLTSQLFFQITKIRKT